MKLVTFYVSTKKKILFTWRLCRYDIILQQSDWCGSCVVGMIDHTGANLYAWPKEPILKHRIPSLSMYKIMYPTSVIAAYLQETFWNDWA